MADSNLKIWVPLLATIVTVGGGIIVAYVQTRGPSSSTSTSTQQQTTFMVDGYVMDQVTNNAVNGAQVSIGYNGAPVETTTDSKGCYHVSFPASGTTLDVHREVIATGYTTKSDDVKLSSGWQDNLLLTPAPKATAGTSTIASHLNNIVSGNVSGGSSSTIGTIYSQGSLTIRGTWSCDLDNGVQGDSDADFYWEQSTAVARYLVPKNGAKFCVMGMRAFDSIALSDLTRLSYSTAQIDGSNAAYNHIPQGAVVAYVTNQNRYGKFIVTTYGYDLGIRWVTYSSK